MAALAIACGSAATLAEPSPTELLQKASSNLKDAKTAHIDGTGSFAISSGLSISFDFKLNGDAEMPDKSRLTTQMSLLGQSLSVDMDGDLGIPGASPTAGGSKFEISFDIKFTHIGEPISPAITAPPTN